MFWTLPGARRYLKQVVEALSKGQHVILRLPKHVIDQDPIESLDRWLVDAGLGSVTSHWVDEDVEPERALARATYFEDEEAPLSAILDNQRPPSNFIALLGLPTEEGRFAREWRRLLKRAGANAQNREGRPPFQIVAVASPRMPIPDENVRLAQFPWWGVLSLIDIDQVVEEDLRNSPPERSVDHYWLRALCRGLVGTQPQLAEALLRHNPKTLKDLLAFLKAKEEEAPKEEPKEEPKEGYEIPKFKKKFAFLGEAMPPPPTEEARLQLWDDGWLDWEAEYGARINVYALAHMGQKQKIERRLWQGQSKILLPLVEQVRHLIVNKLRAKYGMDDWSYQIAPKVKEKRERDALETEIGPLAYHLRKASKQKRSLREMAGVAEKWRDLRNELAHVNIVEHEALLVALDAARALMRD